MEEYGDSGPPSAFINKVIFLFLGIASLLGWNALLTKLDFFNYFLSDINPFRSFSFLNYILNITFQFILIYKKNLMPLKAELIGGIVGSIIFLVLLPLSASLLGQNEMINKIITVALIVLMGFINALVSGGSFSYAGHFPLDMIVFFTVGQGVSAIVMNVLEYIVLVSVHIDDEKKEYILRAWIFFGSAIIILLICLFFFLYSYKDEYCKYYLNKAENKISNSNKQDDQILPLTSLEEKSGNNEEENDIKEQIKSDDYNDEDVKVNVNIDPKFSYVFKKIWYFDILACYIYIVTFSLFPSVSTDQEIFNIGDYNPVTIITIYNVFDTLGRYIVRFLKQSSRINSIIVLGRSILLFTLIFNHYLQHSNNASETFTSIFLIANVALLGITNGIGATLTFGLVSRSTEDEIKKQAGGSIGFFSILGIFLGSCLAFGTGAITDTFKKK